MINSINQQKFLETFENLTTRRKEVLKKVLAGDDSDEAIADSLGIKEPTVRKYLERFYEAFGVKRRADLVTLFAKYMPELLRDGSPQSVVETHLPIEGQAEPTTNFYIERPPIESICYQTLLQPGSLLRIKAPSGMGKTRLIQSVLPLIEKQGYRTVLLDFGLADKGDLTNLDELLRWFSANVSKILGLPNKLNDYWDEKSIGSMVSCTHYFQEYLLSHADTPLVLCLDRVDRVFPYQEIAADFFSLLRSWYERANIGAIWKKLRLVLLHSTEVYISLDINHSPFASVGVEIELPEFTPEQVYELAKQYQLNWNNAQVKQLMEMVGGHPYLVQKALYYLRNYNRITLDEFLQIAPTEAGIYRNELRGILFDIQSDNELVDALKKVITATSSVQLKSTHNYKLQSMGLLKLEGDNSSLRCELYRRYFRDRLGDS